MKQFPPFRLDNVNQCLWHRGCTDNDERILLTPKAFAVLRYLVERAGQLVTQDELLSAVWPNTFVQPEVLKYQVADIRSTLGDNAKNPSYIETLPRRGYRFAAPVSEVGAGRVGTPAQLKRDELVGRAEPLNLLGGHLQTMLHGERRIVFITGEPGIGKTALIDEFQQRAAAELSGIHTARGHALKVTAAKNRITLCSKR